MQTVKISDVSSLLKPKGTNLKRPTAKLTQEQNDVLAESILSIYSQSGRKKFEDYFHDNWENDRDNLFLNERVKCKFKYPVFSRHSEKEVAILRRYFYNLFYNQFKMFCDEKLSKGRS
jgi:hypothetical protein